MTPNSAHPATAYDFTRCDQCGAPLAPEDQLWGLCPSCQEGSPMQSRKPARTESRGGDGRGERGHPHRGSRWRE